MRNRLRSLLAAAALAALVPTACSGGGTDSSAPGTSSADQAASEVTTPPADAVPPPVSAAPDQVFALAPWWVRDDGLAQGQSRFVTGPDVLRSTLDTLLAGPTDDDAARGLGTAISPRVQVLDLSVEGDTAIVNLSRPFETADTQPQVGQVVWTLTELAGITKVKFLIDGEDNGATGVHPLTRAETRVQPAA